MNLVINVRKENIKRVVFVGISNEQLLWDLCKSRHGLCVCLCKSHSPWHVCTEFVWYITIHRVCFLYKRIL